MNKPQVIIEVKVKFTNKEDSISFSGEVFDVNETLERVWKDLPFDERCAVAINILECEVKFI